METCPDRDPPASGQVSIPPCVLRGEVCLGGHIRRVGGRGEDGGSAGDHAISAITINSGICERTGEKRWNANLHGNIEPMGNKLRGHEPRGPLQYIMYGG